MKRLLLIVPFILLFFSCDNTIKAEYNTVKTKKLILMGEDGKEYALQVKNDSTGNGKLMISKNEE